MILSSALVYSTRPPVSVYGTGALIINDSGFSRESVYLPYPLVQALKVLSGSTRIVDLPAILNIYTL